MTSPIVALSAATQAKAALFARLRAEAEGGLLAGWSVDYSYNGNAGAQAIYGGGWRVLSREDIIAEQRGLVVQEQIEVFLYIRYKVTPAASVEDTDAQCDAAALTIAQVMFNQPKIAGGMTWLGISTAQGDYSQTGLETISTHGYAVRIDAYSTWRPS